MQTDNPPKLTKPQDFMPSERHKSTQSQAPRKAKRMTAKTRQSIATQLRAIFKPTIDAAQRNKQ